MQKGLACGRFHLAISITALPANFLFGALYQDYGALVLVADMLARTSSLSLWKQYQT